MPTICLCMIVKNEADVIARCLNSVRNLISYYVIVDTGSTDGTQDIIKSTMTDVDGIMIDRPWVNFAHNRSEALDLARYSGCEYSLVIDADDELIQHTTDAPLDADAYSVTIQDEGLMYSRIQLFNNNCLWKYVGVLHEYPECESAYNVQFLPWVIKRNHDGARQKNANTYLNDIKVLEDALTVETDPDLVSRYVFYLAQSYRDAGQVRQALSKYMHRVELGGWSQEVYISLLNAGRLIIQLINNDEFTSSEVKQLKLYAIELFNKASRLENERAEAAYEALKLGDNTHALRLVMTTSLSIPDGTLFAEPWIYSTGLKDELAVNQWFEGNYELSLNLCLDLLQKDLPVDDRARIQANSEWALTKMVQGNSLNLTPSA